MAKQLNITPQIHGKICVLEKQCRIQKVEPLTAFFELAGQLYSPATLIENEDHRRSFGHFL